MEKYYNHLTDKLEDLEPFMSKALPRSKEEYEARLKERQGAADSLRGFSKRVTVTLDPHPSTLPTDGDEVVETSPMKKATKDYIEAVKEYLDTHPEEVIKLRDEKLVQEMVDFAAKQNADIDPNAHNGAPTEEEVYLAKREVEGRPLIIHEESGNFPTEETWEKLKAVYKKEEGVLNEYYGKMTPEAQDRLVEAVNILGKHFGSDHDIDNKEIGEFEGGHAATYPVTPKEAIEPSRYMMGTDPYGDDNSKGKVQMFKRDEYGNIESVKNEEDILDDEDDDDDAISDAEDAIAMYILIGTVVFALITIVWLAWWK